MQHCFCQSKHAPLLQVEEHWVKPNTPMGRSAAPSEIATLIAFLANNEEASYVTGAMLIADGGTSINVPGIPQPSGK
jgi:NAD(P)-dependent dehydrogenase (short-subunit alcohol dehydrogenase family)